MKCKCGSDRIISISAKCSDCFGMTIYGRDYDGYVPKDIGVGGGDYIELDYCMECGQIQGKFPLPQAKFEIDLCITCGEELLVEGDEGRCVGCT